MPNSNKNVILGIDPGLADTGIGVISSSNGQLKILTYGNIKTSPHLSFGERLVKISIELAEIIKKYQPSLAVIEQLFFCKNVKTAIAVGQARGAIILTCQNFKLEMRELTPLQVKQGLTCYGRAEKKQIQFMVKAILGLKETPKPDDAADALALAICGANSLKWPIK